MNIREFRSILFPLVAMFFLSFCPNAHGQIPHILLNQMEIVCDLGESPLEIFEDDYDSASFMVSPTGDLRCRNDVEDAVRSRTYWRYNDIRSTLDGLIKPFPKILTNNTHFEIFIQNNIDLLRGDTGVYDEHGNLLYKIAQKKNLPFVLTGLIRPITIKLGLRSKGNNWWYILSDVQLPTTHSTCSHDKRCLAGLVPTYSQPSGKCCWLPKEKRWRPVGDTDEDGDEDGDDEQEEYDVILAPVHCYSNDIAKNHDTLLKNEVLSALSAVIQGGSTTPDTDVAYVKEFKLDIKDRTPPHICDAAGNEPYSDRLPDLWGSTSTVGYCTTGDYNRVEEITLKDNNEGTLKSRFAVGVRNESGEAEDAKFIWAGNPLSSPSGSKVNYIFVPNECKGTMKYAIFCWDQENNINPGVPRIAEDSPTSCYGLGSSYPNLKRDKGFPFIFKEDYAGPMDNPGSQEYSGDRLLWALQEDKLPAKLGDINISDNDRPNVLIRIESIKDKGIETLYADSFPPPSQTLTTSDPDYAQLLAGTNSQEDFLGLKGGEQMTVVPLSFAYLSNKTAESSTTETSTESVGALDKFKSQAAVDSVLIKDGTVAKEANGESKVVDSNTTEEDGIAIDTNFTAMNFRLESYSTSDTDTSGNPIVNDDKTYGERNGFGREALLASKNALTEDVEYLVWIWAEDNVKWSSIPGERIAKSGIRQCEIKIQDPNQNPPLSISKSIGELDAQTEDPTKKELDRFWHGPYRLVCREPTTTFSTDSLIGNSNPHSFLENNKNPFVEAMVTDYSGNVRALKVYFQVSDVKARVRIIEQKHIRN